MNAVSQNPLINRARDCMVRPADQKRIRNDAPMFVRQLDLIEIKDDDDVLVGTKGSELIDTVVQALLIQ